MKEEEILSLHSSFIVSGVFIIHRSSFIVHRFFGVVRGPG
jgi:hypothetical protein